MFVHGMKVSTTCDCCLSTVSLQPVTWLGRGTILHRYSCGGMRSRAVNGSDRECLQQAPFWMALIPLALTLR